MLLQIPKTNEAAFRHFWLQQDGKSLTEWFNCMLERLKNKNEINKEVSIAGSSNAHINSNHV